LLSGKGRELLSKGGALELEANVGGHHHWLFILSVFAVTSGLVDADCLSTKNGDAGKRESSLHVCIDLCFLVMITANRIRLNRLPVASFSSNFLRVIKFILKKFLFYHKSLSKVN